MSATPETEPTPDDIALSEEIDETADRVIDALFGEVVDEISEDEFAVGFAALVEAMVRLMAAREPSPELIESAGTMVGERVAASLRLRMQTIADNQPQH